MMGKPVLMMITAGGHQPLEIELNGGQRRNLLEDVFSRLINDYYSSLILPQYYYYYYQPTLSLSASKLQASPAAAYGHPTEVLGTCQLTA